jgi:uncharacterized membrane protein YgcG
MEDAVAGLQVAETQSMKVAERDELGTAWRELLKHKPVWAQQYPADLMVHFKANAAAAAQAARVPESSEEQQAAAAVASSSAFASLTHASFSLVDDQDVSKAIESSRLLQLVLPAVDHILAELNKLISTVQGLPNVRPELNPLRPEVFAQTLREMAVASKAEPAVVSLWLKYMADPLGRELKRLYERLVNQLELANVQGATYRVLQTPASVGRGRGQGGNGSSAAASGSGGGAGGEGSGDGGGAGVGKAALASPAASRRRSTPTCPITKYATNCSRTSCSMAAAMPTTAWHLPITRPLRKSWSRFSPRQIPARRRWPRPTARRIRATRTCRPWTGRSAWSTSAASSARRSGVRMPGRGNAPSCAPS